MKVFRIATVLGAFSALALFACVSGYMRAFRAFWTMPMRPGSEISNWQALVTFIGVFLAANIAALWWLLSWAAQNKLIMRETGRKLQWTHERIERGEIPGSDELGELE